MTIQAESLLQKNSQFDGESASISSQLSPNIDMADAKDIGSTKLIKQYATLNQLPRRRTSDQTKLKKMSKLTNKFNSDNDEIEQGFHAFRANSYNSQEHNTRMPFSENKFRRHSYMLVNQ